MLDQLTKDSFEPYLNQTFQITFDDAPAVELTLIQAAHIGAAPEGGQRQPFSVLFSAPVEPALPQRLYRLVHPDLGELVLFLVPVGPDRDHPMRYEAVFN